MTTHTDLSNTAAIELLDAAGTSLGITPATADGDRLTADVTADAVQRAARIRIFDAAGVLLIECPSENACARELNRLSAMFAAQE